jgi:hypothetical protein
MAKIRVAFMKDLMGQYSRDEISFSRMCELINEEASRDDNRDELIEKSVPEISDEEIEARAKELFDTHMELADESPISYSHESLCLHEVQGLRAGAKWYKSELAKRMNNEVTIHDLKADDEARGERESMPSQCRECGHQNSENCNTCSVINPQFDGC